MRDIISVEPGSKLTFSPQAAGGGANFEVLSTSVGASAGSLDGPDTATERNKQATK